MHAPGFPVYQVFPGAGNVPTILVTSEPLSHVAEWQFLGKAPAPTNMPVHQVVHSLQQTLATWTMWTPDMVQKELQIDGSCDKLRLAYEANQIDFNTKDDLLHPPFGFENDDKTGLGEGVPVGMEMQSHMAQRPTPRGYAKAPKNTTLAKHLNIWFPPSPRKKQSKST